MLVRRRRMEHMFAESLDAGADDYISQPFDPEELRARLAVSARVMQLHAKLADRERELQEAVARINQLESISGMGVMRRGCLPRSVRGISQASRYEES